MFRRKPPCAAQSPTRLRQPGRLTPLKDDPGSALEVLLRGGDGGKESLIGTVNVWLADQVIVESPVNGGFCPLLRSCQRNGRVNLCNCPLGPKSGQLLGRGRDTAP